MLLLDSSNRLSSGTSVTATMSAATRENVFVHASGANYR